ncbi:Ribonuclease H2 subunit B [Kappamyces sp. JEL0829]|nr:Ribonuclease H2 subunit B [Kappamyces sp. JEL0829]
MLSAAPPVKRVVIAPNGVDLDCAEFLSLLHPHTDETAVFMLAQRRLYSLAVWENEHNGNVYVATLYNPLFLLVPVLEKTYKQGLCTLDDIFYEQQDSQPLVLRLDLDLHSMLPQICDHSFELEQHFYRLSTEKLLVWLRSKVDALAARIDTFAALGNHLTAASTHGTESAAALMRLEGKVKLAIRAIASQLSSSNRDILAASYGFKDLTEEKLVYFNDEIKRKPRDADLAAKTAKKVCVTNSS